MFRRVLPLTVFLCLAWTVSAVAAPQLRLRVPDELTRPVWVTAGSDGPTDLVFFAYNNGDGALNLEADGGSHAWLGAQIGPASPCSFDTAKSCTPITAVLNTAALPAGTVTGAVQVRAPGALDAPQSVSITVHVGSNIPESIRFYVPPREGAGDSLDFETQRGPAPFLTAAGSFLRVSSSNLGSFRNLHEHRVQAFYQPGLAAGENTGTIFVEGSSFAADNRAVPVTLNVTTQPISVLSASTLTIRATQGRTPFQQNIVVSNRGDGALAVSGAESSTDSGGEWLETEIVDNVIGVRAVNLDGVAPGLYRGTVRVDSNAANSPQQVIVFLDLRAEGPPTASYRGAVNGATFNAGTPLAPGTITSLFGDQLSFGFEQATVLPLPREMGGARIVVSNLDGSAPVDAPLFFVSSGQLNFQIPYETTPGTKKLQVIRDGQAGNEITVQVDTRSAGLFRIGIGEYGAVVNATRSGALVSLPMPSSTVVPGFDVQPARPGDVLTFFATGLGPITPNVPTGEAPTVQTNAVDVPIVNFGRSPFGPLADPTFVGLSPGFVGLFQVNVPVPVDAPTDARTRVTLEYPDGRRSNTIEVAVER